MTENIDEDIEITKNKQILELKSAITETDIEKTAQQQMGAGARIRDLGRSVRSHLNRKSRKNKESLRGLWETIHHIHTCTYVHNVSSIFLLHKCSTVI